MEPLSLWPEDSPRLKDTSVKLLERSEHEHFNYAVKIPNQASRDTFSKRTNVVFKPLIDSNVMSFPSSNSINNRQYDNYVQRPLKDYSHLEPPRALPSREQRPPFPTREATDSQEREHQIIDSLKPVKHLIDETYSQEDMDIQDWLRDYSKSNNEINPRIQIGGDASKPPWDDEDDDDYSYRSQSKSLAGDTEDSEWLSKPMKNGEKYEELIGPPKNDKRTGTDHLKKLLSSMKPPTRSETSIKPSPIYLTAGKKPSNVLYSSLVDMINVAENLRIKRPSAVIMEEYPDEELSDESGIDLTDDILNEDDSGSSTSGHIHPQVARVQDRGITDDEVASDEEEDWVLPRMGPWDPADTPVATAVLGSVMLFLILVVVRPVASSQCNGKKHSETFESKIVVNNRPLSN